VFEILGIKTPQKNLVRIEVREGDLVVELGFVLSKDNELENPTKMIQQSRMNDPRVRLSKQTYAAVCKQAAAILRGQRQVTKTSSRRSDSQISFFDQADP